MKVSELPTEEKFRASFEKGKSQGMNSWYHDYNALIKEYCMGDQEELEVSIMKRNSCLHVLIFTSLLATCSVNSGIAQNAINALLNFRALSQNLRPRWGSYPYRGLVNYLAGVLGTPSGQKV